MLRRRALITIILLPILIGLIIYGGWPFVIAMALALGIAGYEYGALFSTRSFTPALPLLFIGPAILAVARFQLSIEMQAVILVALVMLAMTWHLINFERGATRSGTDLAITLSGIVYVGLLGGYLISLRFLPDGLYWVLLVLPAVWFADSAAYFAGSAIGRHRMAPKLSPNKTWEGYGAGVLVGAAAGAGLAVIWAQLGASMTWQMGAVVGVIVAAISPLGDLGISMYKREMRPKDTGSILGPHGGLLDRIDTWLRAAVLGYYSAVVMA